MAISKFEQAALLYVGGLEQALGPKIEGGGSLELNLKPSELEWILAVTILRLAQTRNVSTRLGEIKIKLGVPYIEVKIREKVLAVTAEIVLLAPLGGAFANFSYELAESPGPLALNLVGGQLSFYEEKIPFLQRPAFGALGVSIEEVIVAWLSDPLLALEESFALGLGLNPDSLQIKATIESWGVGAKIWSSVGV